MNLPEYLVAELDDSVGRLRSQILDIVPLERQLDRAPGGNSVTWTTFHVARHAALALSIVSDTAGIHDAGLDVFGPDATRGGNGLQEVQQPFTDALEPSAVNDYAVRVFSDVRFFLEHLTETEMDALPDIETALDAARIEHDSFDWLYRLWADQPVSFLVRWPLTGHLTHHIGELTGVRNQMGLSPFR